MPSDSVSSFLDRAQASRLLNPDQVEQIVRQPDLSRMSLGQLSAYLEQLRILTPYQAQLVRSGRGEELHFAGYPIQEDLGSCPGGTAYKVLHPSLRTPMLLRRLRTDWFAPADNAAAYVQRARAASTLTHPNLVPLIDAGVYRDEAYVVLEPQTDASNLEALVRDIGPMPSVLAVDYVRQAGAALRTVHERGGWHGDIQPRNLLVGPLIETPKLGADGRPVRRPGPASIARVSELGLVPIRPNASSFLNDLEGLPYLPPERVEAPGYSARGDLYGLGAILFFLLTGRPPFPGTTSDDILLRVRTAEAPPLEALRPDLAPPLVAVIKQLLAKDPNLRPASALEVEAKLAPYGRPNLPVAVAAHPEPSAAVMVATPAASSVFPNPGLPPGAVQAPGSSSSYAGIAEWSAAAAGSSSSFAAGHSGTFSTATATAGPVVREFTAADRARTRMWFVLGGIMQVLAILGWCYFLGCFDSSTQSNPPSNTNDSNSVEPKKEPPKVKKKRPIDER